MNNTYPYAEAAPLWVISYLLEMIVPSGAIAGHPLRQDKIIWCSRCGRKMSDGETVDRSSHPDGGLCGGKSVTYDLTDRRHGLGARSWAAIRHNSHRIWEWLPPLTSKEKRP